MRKKGIILLVLILLIAISHIVFQNSRLIQDLHERVRQISYELRFSIVESKKASQKVILIQVDDHSYPADLPKYPIDRAYLAALVNRISSKHPDIIGLNVVLDRPTYPSKDELLRDAITRAGNVVLRESRQYGILKQYREAAKESGVQVWGYDSTGTLQKVCANPARCNATSLFHDVLWKYYSSGSRTNPALAQEQWMTIVFNQFNDEDVKSRYYSAAQIDRIPKDQIEGAMVLIGINFNGLTPHFKTPLYQRGGSQVSEIEVMDQLMQNLIKNEQIIPVNSRVTLVLLVAFLAIVSIFAVKGRYLLYSISTVVFVVIAIALSLFLFAYFLIDIPYSLLVLEAALFYMISILVLLNYEKVENLTQSLELEKRQSLLKSAKLEHLSNQLNTHSLFNEFSRIKGLIALNPDKARDYLVQFSNMLKYSLLYSDKESTPLDVQIEFLRFYIEQQELLGTLQFDLQVEGDTASVHIPWNSLFILVENAVKHSEAVLDENAGQSVQIELSVKDDRLRFQVRNAFDPERVVPSTKTGLKNLKQRLSLCYRDKDYSLEFSNNRNTWTSKLNIPAIFQPVV